MINTILFSYLFSLSVYPSIAWFFLFVSNVLIYLFILTAIIFPIIKNRDYIYGILIAGTGAVAWIVSFTIKNIFMIPRPFITLHLTPLILESGYSFPSSHVTVISALSIVVWKMNHKLGYLFFFFTILVMFSRVIIGVHYPADVIGGLFFGIITGFIIIWFYKKTNKLAFLRKIIS